MSFINANDAAMGVSNYTRRAADHYPTPSWITDAGANFLLNHIHGVSHETPVWEPACGDGQMAKVIKQHFTRVESTDLCDYGYGLSEIDFLAQNVHFDGIIFTNPPFNLAEGFIRQSLKITERHHGVVGMVLRHEYDCAKGRVDLFNHEPFAAKLVLTKRPMWVEGSTGSPRHNYAIYFWSWKHVGPANVFYHVC